MPTGPSARRWIRALVILALIAAALVTAWYRLPWLFTGKAAIVFLVVDILATPPAIFFVARRRERQKRHAAGDNN